MDRQTTRKTLIAFVLFLAATGVVRADKTDDFIKAEGYGLANIKLKIPAKPETVYKICSVSKQFIAAGIMLLVQEGRQKRISNPPFPPPWFSPIGCARAARAVRKGPGPARLKLTPAGTPLL